MKSSKEYIKELRELVKEFGYWSNEVNEYNNNLISKIGVGEQYYIIQNIVREQC